jgi:cytochrome c556
VVKRWMRYGIVLAVGLALLLCWTTQPGDAQVKKGKSRVAETKYLMRGVVQPNCAGIAAMLKDKDKGPADDKQWEQIVQFAEVLNEMSFVLMDDGRCPDKDWADAATTLRDCSAKITDAAKAKNTDDVRAAFKGVLGSCSACHTVYKNKKK